MTIRVRRVCALLLATAIVGSLTTGCGALRKSAEPTAIPPVELDLATLDMTGPWSHAEESLLEQFKQRQPNVTVNRMPYRAAPGNYLAQPPTPDLMVISAGYPLAQAIQLGQVVDLTDLWEQSGLAEQFPPSFRELSALDGKQYYVPIGYTWSAIYYNQALFDQFDLQPPATWTEFTELCDTLLANGITPFSYAGNDFWTNTLWLDYLDLRLNGADFHRQLLKGEIPYTDERVLAVLELWSWMLQQGYFMEHPERLSLTDSLMAIVTDKPGLSFGDKAAMTLTSPSWLGALPANLRQDLDFFALPAIAPAVPQAEVLLPYGYMVPANAEQRDVALAFIEFAATAEAQTAMAARLSAGTPDLAPANSQADDEALPEAVRRGAQLVRGAQGVTTLFPLGVPDSMWLPVDAAVDRFLRQPADIEAFAQALESARQATEAAGGFIRAE